MKKMNILSRDKQCGMLSEGREKVRNRQAIKPSTVSEYELQICL